MKNKIKKILIANRGEIAIRIYFTLRKLNIDAIGIYSEEDKNSYHRYAIPCIYLGKGNLIETYLNIEKIIEIAKKNHCNAIHPGYGFLSENYLFAKRCEEENIIFIGPSSNSIKLMGDKLLAKSIARKLKIPVLESITGSLDEIQKHIEEQNIKYPLLVKASAGGGGKGMKVISSRENMKDVLESASREALNYFGNPEIYVEKYIENPRHIEVQIVGNKNPLHLFERECSIQRRHQKIIEEAPSVSLDNERKQILYEYALQIGREIDYQNLGTVEFLYDEETKNFYFLEMNTRIQVEHPVTEMITGLDLVKLQVDVINENLDLRQENISVIGHSIEARVYAEDPENDFLPSPGRILTYVEPQMSNIRIDSSIKFPSEISSMFDPMISKIISYGRDREEAIRYLIYGLKNYIIHGVKTNINYLVEILESEDFKENKISTNFTKKFNYKDKISEELITFAIALHSRNQNQFSLSSSNSKLIDVWNYIGNWRNV